MHILIDTEAGRIEVGESPLLYVHGVMEAGAFNLLPLPPEALALIAWAEERMGAARTSHMRGVLARYGVPANQLDAAVAEALGTWR